MIHCNTFARGRASDAAERNASYSALVFKECQPQHVECLLGVRGLVIDGWLASGKLFVLTLSDDARATCSVPVRSTNSRRPVVAVGTDKPGRRERRDR